jgi:oxygen-dependent protoporphyrinogen oxidase
VSVAPLTGTAERVAAPEARRRRVLIVGGGISGLACALRLKGRGVDVCLLEASERPGGVIDSQRDSEFLLELGPNSVLLKPEFEGLVEEAGLDRELLHTPMRNHPRFVYKRGHGLLEVPTSVLAFLRTPLLSWRSKLLLAREPFLFSLPKGEVTVADFARHHMGREMFEMLIAPFISGVYAGDPAKMSLPGALPRMRALVERGHGSLTRGAVAKMLSDRRARDASGHRKRRRPSSLCTFDDGLRRLPQAIAEILGEDFCPRTEVRRIELTDQAWRISARSREGDEVWAADALIVATPSHVARGLITESLPDAAVALAAIPYTSVTVIHLGVPLDSVKSPPRGFGFLVPRGHGLRILGALYSSAVFEGRAPQGQSLLTVFCGGATDPDVSRLDDTALMDFVERDLRVAMGWDGRRTFQRITRYERALPEYLLGHVVLTARIESAAALCPAPVGFVGNYLHGISIADCIRQANEVTSQITSRLEARP